MMNILEEITTPPELSAQVQSDKIQLLYRQSFPAIFISLVNAILLMAILWSVQDHRILLTWFSTLLVTSIFRIYLFRKFIKASPKGLDILAWEKPYFITLMLSSLIWGVGCLFIMPTDSQLHQAIVFSFLSGMSGGAISVYSAHREMTLTALSTLILPITVYFLFNGEFVFFIMAIAAIIFLLSAIRSTSVLSHVLHQNFQMARQLKISKEEAEKLARVDELTSLYNRRAFYEYGKLLTNNSQRHNEELSMIFMDIDNFKIINDNFGHAAGDAALKQIGNILLQRLRKSDIYARIGGDEFGMLLPQTSSKKAIQLAEEFRSAIESTPITYEDNHFSLTASFGVTSGVCDIDTLVRQADTVMYQSKGAGRNTVIFN